jgi:hypothetical protein
MAKRLTKKQAAQNVRDAWRAAVAERRVVMHADGGRMHPTPDAALAALAELRALGFNAWIPEAN